MNMELNIKNEVHCYGVLQGKLEWGDLLEEWNFIAEDNAAMSVMDLIEIVSLLTKVERRFPNG